MGRTSGKASHTLIDGAKYVLVMGAAILLVAWAAQGLGYYWQWYRVPRYLIASTATGLAFGPLLEGLFVTLRITASSMCLAFLFGLAAALLRLSGSSAGRAVSRVYLELIRNTPLLIQLFFLYFALAPIFGLGAFATAVLSLGLFEGAYISEILRAGILSVPAGQWEASRSLGLSSRDAYLHVILPQAFRNVLPPLTSQAVSLVKDSALVSTIAIFDLTMQGQAIVADTFLAFEVWFVVAAIYLALTLGLSMLARGLEKKMGSAHA